VMSRRSTARTCVSGSRPSWPEFGDRPWLHRATCSRRACGRCTCNGPSRPRALDRRVRRFGSPPLVSCSPDLHQARHRDWPYHHSHRARIPLTEVTPAGAQRRRRRRPKRVSPNRPRAMDAVEQPVTKELDTSRTCRCIVTSDKYADTDRTSRTVPVLSPWL